MKNATIDELLDGNPETESNLRELQSLPGVEDLTYEERIDYHSRIDDALKEVDKKKHPHNVSILNEDSAALQMAADDVLDFDFIVRAKMDKRYSGDPCQRDHLYVKAVNTAVKELAHAQEKAQAGESSDDSEDRRSWRAYIEE